MPPELCRQGSRHLRDREDANAVLRAAAGMPAPGSARSLPRCMESSSDRILRTARATQVRSPKEAAPQAAAEVVLRRRIQPDAGKKPHAARRRSLGRGSSWRRACVPTRSDGTLVRRPVVSTHLLELEIASDRLCEVVGGIEGLTCLTHSSPVLRIPLARRSLS